MAEKGWTQGIFQAAPVFPSLLTNALESLGVSERPRYYSREYEHHGTLRCRVILVIAKSDRYPDIQPWRVTTTGFRYRDTYPLVVMKALRYMCQIFEEHLYTEQMQVALRTAINAFPRQTGTPRVLLTTFPSEQHGLGLLMVEAMMVPEGVQCISLGPQTPLEDIRRAAVAHKVHIVALSFSAAFPVRQASDGLAALRRQLPASMGLWAGGEMTRRVRKTMPGIMLIPDLASIVNALRSWRAHWVP